MNTLSTVQNGTVGTCISLFFYYYYFMYVRLYVVFAISLHLMQVNKAAYICTIFIIGWFAKFQDFK